MRVWTSIDPEKQKELLASEDSTMYGQAIHYANGMVSLLIPLDIGNRSNFRRWAYKYKQVNTIWMCQKIHEIKLQIL